jgi:hypothetical protein
MLPFDISVHIDVGGSHGQTTREQQKKRTGFLRSHVQVPNLPAPARRQALIGLAAAYAFLSILVVAQQIAIWSSLAGTLLSAECILHAAAFAWLGTREHGSSRLATH